MSETTAAEVYARKVASGQIDPECPQCLKMYGTPKNPTPNAFGPPHVASRRCKSGSAAHCTCDTCF